MWASFHELLKLACGEQRCLCCLRPFLPNDATALLQFFCPDCQPSFTPRASGYCPFCGECAAWPMVPIAPCIRCVQNVPPWRHFCFYAEYDGLLRDALLRLKYSGHTYLGRALGELLAQHTFFQQHQFELCVPVPLHIRRLQQRGYNQAAEIVLGLYHSLSRQHAAGVLLHDAPRLALDALVRVGYSSPQSGLSRSERFSNTKGIFSASPIVRGAHVLLVDDVFTTGATILSATQALLQAGAAVVSVAVVGRTLQKKVF